MRSKKINILLLLCTISSVASASKDSLLCKGKFYIGWGYNRDWFTKGNIHLVNNNPQLINGTYYTYDFTIFDSKAKDRDK